MKQFSISLATKEMLVKTVNFLLFTNRRFKILKRKKRAAGSPKIVLKFFLANYLLLNVLKLLKLSHTFSMTMGIDMCTNARKNSRRVNTKLRIVVISKVKICFRMAVKKTIIKNNKGLIFNFKISVIDI